MDAVTVVAVVRLLSPHPSHEGRGMVGKRFVIGCSNCGGCGLFVDPTSLTWGEGLTTGWLGAVRVELGKVVVVEE